MIRGSSLLLWEASRISASEIYGHSCLAPGTNPNSPCVKTKPVPYFLGIDGGGTKTTCAVGDESNLLATATAGPSNIVRVGEGQARESLQRSVRQACAAAG